LPVSVLSVRVWVFSSHHKDSLLTKEKVKCLPPHTSIYSKLTTKERENTQLFQFILLLSRVKQQGIFPKVASILELPIQVESC
jgi:hypothetical protein